MNQSTDLAFAFFERIFGMPLEQIQPVPVSGWELVEILWPLNDYFRPRLDRIKTLHYDPSCEAAADYAIEAFADHPILETWRELPLPVWRVLLERQQQLILVALVNEKEGNTITHLPDGLPDSARLPGVMLLLLHGMKLPWPAKDRARFVLPEGKPH